MAEKFTTQIEIINGNPYVFVPIPVLEVMFEKFGKRVGQIPVKGRLNNSDFKQTLVKYGGDWRLYLNGVMLKKAGIMFKPGDILSVVGTTVTVELDFDSESRTLSMHPKLKIALAADLTAKAAYDKLAPYRKHEILRYLGFMKSETTTDKNVVRIIKHLRGEETDALYPLMHRKKPQ